MRATGAVDRTGCTRRAGPARPAPAARAVRDAGHSVRAAGWPCPRCGQPAV